MTAISNGSITGNVVSGNLSDFNETVVNQTEINETQTNESLINETVVNQTEINETEEVIEDEPLEKVPKTDEVSKTDEAEVIVVTKPKAQIRIGQPVKWIKNVTLDKVDNVTIELPEEAEEIIVKKIEEGIEKEVITSISGKVSAELDLERGINLWEFIANIFRRLTGNVVSEENLIIEVELNESVTEYVIEYETEAPQAFEEETGNGKKVIISGPDELNYTDVISFTAIEERLPVGEEDRIKIFWEEDSTFIEFDVYDTDSNGLLDYVEWITPHLSNQTFNIILITRAEHLNSERGFIEDIYGLVKERDQNWSDPISAGEYVRVWFEKNLTNINDITIYARSSDSGSVEVYEKDGVEKIADFGVIGEDKKYRILLTDLVGEQDTFDLKIINGDVEFDFITDPFVDNGSLIQTIYDCGTLSTANAVYTLNQSITATGAVVQDSGDSEGSVIEELFSEGSVGGEVFSFLKIYWILGIAIVVISIILIVALFMRRRSNVDH